VAKLPDPIFNDLWSYAIDDYDPIRQARVIKFLDTQRPWKPQSMRLGRRSLDDRLWSARAVAALLVTRIHDRDQGTLVEAAGKALAMWPRRGLPPPSVDTLLTYHRFFRRQMNRGEVRGPAINAAARYYGALHAFTVDDTIAELRALLVRCVGFK